MAGLVRPSTSLVAAKTWMPGQAGHDREGRHEKVIRSRHVRSETRAYSPVVITEGRQDPLGRRPYRRGGRCRKIARRRFRRASAGRRFRNIEKTLAEAGAKLADLVTMTVFLIDARYTTRMTELRREIFGKDFPASAAITVAGFAQPEMMIEIQCVAD